MDGRFYNIDKKKKLAEWVMVHTTGSTDYDLGLFYIYETANELLKTFYYSERNITKLIPQEVYEIKGENQEIVFTNKVFKVYMDILLVKLIDKRTDVWSLRQLLKIVTKYSWPEEKEIEDAVNVFAAEIDYIKDARHKRHAHLAQENKPNKIHVSARMGNYRKNIRNAIILIDRFVEGEIPYTLNLGSGEEYNLREIINSEL